ncbi:endonuclease/exonuclease/phosphatase family protein [Halomonas sp. McH1-25]|uniref:endonuclease/exonuclease/phosphatase family protein n=1 Tax=unclassified Halomonas TaxID=2609666 RepID=UPI001EF66A33|nr:MULTISPECIES: endonuclease/exonuclease/phosphatase family protein [unclassified Halomonas]MCG7598743.1 endonuclease/exonuclease/phosphatase family protein [Halomonas sp. McH1-25]MCP1340706.1 endonuclease/exonuclease/phosphatase family protein [Halomonas sp. FL8]MCP1359477.1 endonuclease/exonuclease/phosphatase family protein [Halomonas sp. BBD45]MCP1364059.1 endonuclease/exonuclease/phosphatase family protein [Halomonas sp. BBD48]
MLDIGLGIVAAALLVATLVPFLNIRHWWVRGFDFPRLQLASLAAITGATQWLWGTADWRWWSIAACIAVAFIQAAHILPWTPLWPKPVRTATSNKEMRYLTILVSNVLTPNRNSQGLLEQIHEHHPEVVLTLESDDWWGEQLEASLGEEWPHSVRIPLDNLYGMHLYSRIPLEETEVKWLIQSDIPSIHTWLRMPCGARIRFHALHPRPPAPSESEQSLWRDAELLLVGRGIHRHEQPTLLAGDLNDVAWSRTTRRFCRVSGMLDPRRGRGMFSTFHASYPLIRWPLDHIFISEHFTLVNMQRLKAFGSDHFPIIAMLCYRPARADENDTPEADREERKDAAETIEEARQQGDGEA